MTPCSTYELALRFVAEKSPSGLDWIILDSPFFACDFEFLACVCIAFFASVNPPNFGNPSELAVSNTQLKVNSQWYFTINK